MMRARSCASGRAAIGGVAAIVAIVAMLLGAAGAFAAGPGAWWRVDSHAAPTHLELGKEGQIRVSVTNLGDAATSGPVKIIDTLPKGLNATKARLLKSLGGELFECEPKTFPEGFTETVSCTYPGPTLAPFEILELEITVKVVEGSPGPNRASVEGGGVGVEPASTSQPIEVSGAPTPFGVRKYELEPENEGGSRDTQAGSHPFQLTTLLEFNQTLETNTHLGAILPALPALVKDVQAKLPPGLVGDATPNAIPQCSDLDFATIDPNTGTRNLCPPSTAVGVAVLDATEPFTFGHFNVPVPVFNLKPSPGEPARFGFEAFKVPVTLDASVRTGEDYGVVVSVRNASQVAWVLASRVTFWGNPGNPIHDKQRGWNCVGGGFWAKGEESTRPCVAPEPRATTAFLSLPTSCTEPLKSSVLVDSWSEPGVFTEKQSEAEAASHPFEEKSCEALPFGPSLTLEPLTQAASTPSGLNVDVKSPQTSTLSETGLAESALRATTVVLPAAVQLSPSAANGLAGCTEAQIGFTKVNPETQTDEFTPGPPECPDASKVAKVTIRTPDLANPVEGAAYLAEPPASLNARAPNFGGQLPGNPFESLVALYIAAEDPVSRVRVKLAGEVSIDETTGQVISTFKNTPQVPFEDFELKFFDGPRASGTTPPLCGSYNIEALFTPWSGGAVLPSSPSFQITTGPGGSPCSSNPQPFAPPFSAGTTNNQAAHFTNFTTDISRPDADQALLGVSVHLPTGIAGILKNVTLCPEPQATQGNCPAASKIGHTSVLAGLGPDPFSPPEGSVYLTGPYKGAPFGLSVVSPAVAPPFNLGIVVVRSTINVDPNTAAVTINSDPLPLRLRGLPLQLQHVNVTIDRPEFQFNPTNCSPMKIEATLTGAQGTQANVSSPYQAANCASLAFKPKFEASTEAKTSKFGGASLTVRVTSGGLGVANIVKTKVALPIALPSRLTTIQKACLAKVFEANPASCPEGSNIGHAIIHTPVFVNPLEGPAFLVSHGNEAFPDVEFVLQGEGVTIVLDGKTDIKKGITTSTFEALPDAPFTEFLTILPEGQHSALAANGNLCTQSLIMPTTITAQNGTVIQQETKIAVTGCPRVKGFKRKNKLAAALAKCRKQFKHNRHKRRRCERQARRKYPAQKTQVHKRR